MRNNMLIVGTALALSAMPAVAGGPHSGRGFIGAAGVSRGLLGGTRQGHANSVAGTAGNCLCHAVTGALGTGSSKGIARMPLSAGNVALLTNSVVGLGGLGAGRGGGHGYGHAIGLAGIVVGSVSGAGAMGAGLAGAVTPSGGGSHQGGHRGYGQNLVNVSVANANAGMAGRVVNVAILNGQGSHGSSAVNVSALNGSGGSAGKVANVSVLNRTRSHGRSAINVAALNGSNHNGNHGGHGGNGVLAAGVRIINGVPCLPDGTPLTGASAVAALTAISGPGGSHGHHGSSSPGSGSQTSSSSAAPASSAGSTQVASSQGSRQHGYQPDHPDLWWHPGNANVNEPARDRDH